MKTKIILIVAVLVFLYSTCNPPWRITVKNHAGHTKKTELVWSYLGTAPKEYSEPYQSSTIAVDVFLLQTLCVLVSAAAALWLARTTPVALPPSPRAETKTKTESARQAEVRAALHALPGAAEDLQMQAQAKHPSPSSN